MRRVHSWSTAAAVVTIVAILLTSAVAAQSPVPAGGDARIYIPVVAGGQGAADVSVEDPMPPEPAPVTPAPVEPPEQEEPLPPPKGEEQVAELPAPVDSPDAGLWDSDGPAWNDSGWVEMAALENVDWNVAGDYTIGGKLGVGKEPPDYLGDFRRNVDNVAQVRVTNVNVGGSAGAAIASSVGSGAAAVLQVYGPGYATSWSGLNMRNMAAVRTDSNLAGLVVTTGGADPLILGTNNSERARFTSGGYLGLGTTTPGSTLEVHNTSGPNVLRLRANGVATSGAKLNFGDSEYVYIDEPTDDAMRLHSRFEVNLETPRVEVNGVRPILMRRYQDINNNLNTHISADNYYCVATGWASYYDIQEDNAGPSAIWTYTYSGEWWVAGNLRSHIDDDFPDVDVVCFRYELVDYSGVTNLWDPD